MGNILLFFLNALFWAGSFSSIKKVLEHAPALWGATWRIGFAVLAWGIIFICKKKSPKLSPQVIGKLWIAGVFGQGLPFALLFWGERFISAGLAAIINGTVPIWTFLIGLFALKGMETPSLKKILGLVIGFAGVLCIFAPSLTTAGAKLTGVLAVLLMAISYSVGAVMSKRLFSKEKSVSLTLNLFHQLSGSFLFLLLLSCISLGPQRTFNFDLPLAGFGALFYLSFFSTTLAFLIFYHLIKEWGAVRGSSVVYVVPFFALILDFFLTGLLPHRLELLGAMIILSGVLLLHSTKK